MRVAIAAITGDFSGTVKITDAVRPTSFRMAIEGAGRIGHMKGDGAIALANGAGNCTTVSYDGIVQVGGTMAAIGQRMVDTTSKMLIRSFFSNLAKHSAA